ncbi:VOC family protein [Jeongeupia sp. USM3]|uniref:VOC family protein n=1 Tax=Jeongeupia sp. USM3 TaxID=1906741 RepID=UPI00089E016B|nr:VOC family protein [Jeongeupia sp. USM3]AOY00980.1 glyoxalase [Jeongeupia sp. USM3]
MKNPVVHFEIPVGDLERAIAFYEAVFGHELERLAVDGNDMAFFPADQRANGISGALARGASYLPGKQGARIYFGVASIDDTLAKAVSAGGSITYPKTPIGDLGWVAEFEDSEGNCIALHADAASVN